MRDEGVRAVIEEAVCLRVMLGGAGRSEAVGASICIYFGLDLADFQLACRLAGRERGGEAVEPRLGCTTFICVGGCSSCRRGWSGGRGVVVAVASVGRGLLIESWRG